ncbi:MAG: EAL domain-containing protein [Oscillospiraceae bacterium]|nr:EAL domain-containing protein [Oscillospiraceae bacterium]
MENFKDKSFVDYITSGTLQLRLKDFEKYIVNKIKNYDKQYALICIRISNIDFIDSVFGAVSGDSVIDHIILSACCIVQDRGIVLRFSSDYYLVFIEYENKESITSFIEDMNTFCDKNEIFDAHSVKADRVFSIYLVENSRIIDGSITIPDMVDKLAMAADHSDITDGFFYYDDVMHNKLSKEIEIVKSIDKAMENNEFHIFLQPQHYLQHEDRVLSAEALVRWIKKDGTVVYPGDFIPVLEKNGMITKLDCHVMELACKYISQHIDEEWFEGIVISVNVSKVDLKLREFIEYYTNVRNKYNIPDNRIEIEFTESAVFEDYTVFKQIMFELRKSGFYCSIDDFGTGSSSLNMLKSMPVDVLKMDRMFFVCDNDNDMERNNSVIASVVAMARGLGMKIVAEGIESPERIDFLRKIGCDVIQGYVYSKPLSVEDFEKYVKTYIPKYLPISEKLTPAPPEKFSPENAEVIYQKYTQMLPYVNAIVLELDIEADMYRIISFGKEKILIMDSVGEYSSFFDNVILKNTHKDFRKEAIKRISLKGILSAFYRGDSETEYELMMKLYDADESTLTADYIWCLYHIHFQKISRHSKPMATIFLSDIQEQKEKEISCLTAERKLKAAVKSMKCDILDIDFDIGKITIFHTNDYYDSRFSDDDTDKSEEYDIDDYLENVVIPEDYDRLKFVLNSVSGVYGGNVSSAELYTEYRIMVDGEKHWKSISFMPESDENTMHTTAIMQDITGYKRLEEKAISSEQTLYKFVSAMCACVIEIKFDIQTVNIIKADAVFSDIFRCGDFSEMSFNEFIRCVDGIMMSKIVHADDKEDFGNTFSLDVIKENLFTKSLQYMEHRIFSDDIYKWFEVRIFNNASDAMLFISDVDDHKINLLRKQRDARRDQITGTYQMDDFDDIVQEFIERDGRNGEHMMINISLCAHDIPVQKESDFVMCLKKCVRKDDVIGRSDDSSYFVFLKSIGKAFAQRFVEKTMQIFESIRPDDSSLREFCMGISLLVDADKTVDKLKEQSSVALKDANVKGAGAFCIYDGIKK